MSTGTFSARNTALVIEPVLRFFVPSITSERVALIHGIIRKSGHVTEYFILGILLFRALRSGSEKFNLSWVIYSLLILALYAAADEFHQGFVADRTPTLSDVGIDTFAGFLAQGVSVLRALRRRQNHMQSRHRVN
jgi:VanZ family protein